jgi:anti-sigma factor RsiW
MRCEEVQDRLVAYDDQELSPGEHSQVAEHLRGCADCRALHADLRAVTPRPHAVVPEALMVDLQLRLEALLDADPGPAAREPEAPAPWWQAETRVPAAVTLAYAAAFMLVAMWGAYQWKAHQDLRLALTATPDSFIVAGAEPASAPTVAEPLVEGAHFRPASWTPEPAAPEAPAPSAADREAPPVAD